MPRKQQKEFVVISELEHTLLSLVVHRSLYGLEFQNAIQSATEGRRKLKFGSLYTTLNRMEKKGFVSSRWGDESNGPRRKYYDITPAGKSALQEYRQYLKKLDLILINVEANPVENEASEAATTLAPSLSG